MREQPALSAKGEGEGKAQQPAPTKSKKAKIAEEKAAREAADAEAKVQYHFVCSNQCVVHCTCVNSGAPPIGSGATASSQYTQPTSSSTTHSEWIASGYSSSSSSSSSSFASASASAGATALTSALDHFLSGTVPNTPQNAAAVAAMASHLKCGGCTSGVGRHRADCSKSMESTAAYTRAQLAGNLAGASAGRQQQQQQQHQPPPQIHKSKSEQAPSRSRASSSRDGAASSNRPLPAFLTKLYTIVNHETPLCVWSAEGDTFIINDSAKFGKKVLSKYFKSGNFQSFVRQLHFYNFRYALERKGTHVREWGKLKRGRRRMDEGHG
jgi:hypothetical protein